MRGKKRRMKALAAAIAALAAAPASVIAEVDFLASRPGVADAVLAGIRGGISTPQFFMTFSIVRTVTVNDTTVLTQRLTIPDLAQTLRSGIAPQVATENLGVGVAVGSGNSLNDAIAGQTIGSAAVVSQPAPAAPAPAPTAPGPQQVAPAPVGAQAAAPQPVTQAQQAAPQVATPPAASTSTAAAAQPAPQPAQPASAVTTPLVVSVPSVNGAMKAMVIQVPSAEAITATVLQNTANGAKLGITQSLEWNAKLLDAARIAGLREQILNSIKMPH